MGRRGLVVLVSGVLGETVRVVEAGGDGECG
jgi:hypothetical protein